MSKTIRAVVPYFYEGKINFKHKPYDAWRDMGMPVAEAHYPWRLFHKLAFSFDFPRLREDKREARLRFVQPYSLSFDAWPDYMLYEVIPFFWDVWPDNFERVCRWLKRYDVKSAVFTASKVGERIQAMFPKMNVIVVTEGIDVGSYHEGKPLDERKIDFLHYGREIDNIVRYDFSGLNYLSGKENGKAVLSQDKLYEYLADAKIVAAYPKSWTNPDEAGGIDTLTQRYWECMLSRCIMIGHAPQELIDLIGYNPVIELDRDNPQRQLEYVLDRLSDYQALADKNRAIALKYGDWKYSVNRVVEILHEIYG